MTRVFECQSCGINDTDKEQFKYVKIHNIKIVYCVECVKLLQERLKSEEALRDAHQKLSAARGPEWDTAHELYKQKFNEASRLRHLQNVREYGLEQ